jgi:DNA-binding MarR family transcriptional regulator
MQQESIGKVLSMTHRAHHALVDERLRELGLGVSSGQFFLLLGLYRNDGIHQQELAEYYRIDKAAVARGIKKLEELGLVTRLPSPEDHRKSLLRITEKARELRPLFTNVIGGIEERIRSYLTEEEIDSFLRIAETIRSGLGRDLASREEHTHHTGQPYREEHTHDNG